MTRFALPRRRAAGRRRTGRAAPAITDAVHEAGGRIAMQILHFGRYAYHPDLVAPSPMQAPISPFRPGDFSDEDVERTIDDYVRCSRGWPKNAGYDGAEIMGSEGYLINEFIARQTNKRTRPVGRQLRQPDALSGRDRPTRPRGRRHRFHHHLPALDARSGARGTTFDEVVELALAIQDAATILNTASAGTRPASRPSRPWCRWARMPG